jgi:hypothetical protein
MEEGAQRTRAAPVATSSLRRTMLSNDTLNEMR